MRAGALEPVWYGAARRDAAATRASIVLKTKPPSPQRTNIAALRLFSGTHIATTSDDIDFPQASRMPSSKRRNFNDLRDRGDRAGDTICH
jgi:hypothetical protein